jgi:hypothetical protein
MSEERNDAGQFTPSTDGLYGREAELANAGLKQMPDASKPPEPEELSAREAGEALAASRESDPVTPIQYQTGEGERADPDEAVTLDRAARDLATHRASQVDSAAKSISSDFANAIDALRNDAIKEGLDPKETGLDKVSPTADAPEGTSEKSGIEPAEPGMEHLDPEVQKALKIPVVKEALEREFAQADEAKAQFSQTLDVAQRLAQATLLELAPGLGHLQAHEIEPALQRLAQTDPARAQAIVNTLEKAQRIEFAQQQQAAAQQQARQQAISKFRAEQSAEFTRTSGMSQAEQAEAAEDIAAYAESNGVSRQDLVSVMEQSPWMTHALFQRMMVDATRYNKLMQSAKPRPSSPIPPVQRPGTSNRATQSDSGTSELARRFASSAGDKQVRAAAALIASRRNARK